MGAFLERSAARPALCTALRRYDCAEVAVPHGMSTSTLAALRTYCRPAGGAAGGGAVLVQLPAALAAAAGIGTGGGGDGRAAARLSEALPPQALREVVQALHHHTAGAVGQPVAVAAQLKHAALQALALAVSHLQRCGVAAELLPTMRFGPLGVEGLSGEARPEVPMQSWIPESQQACPRPSAPSVQALLSSFNVPHNPPAAHADAPRGLPTPEPGAAAHAPEAAAASAAAPRQFMLLDDRALTTLHVLAADGGGRPGSLLAALDGTASAAGRRALRRWLCRPLAVASHIEERLAVVDLFKVGWMSSPAA